MSDHPIRGKINNDYALAVGRDLYASIPKAVWAAIAVSALTQGGDRLDEAAALVAREWAILHSNGIVPQAPNKMAGEAV
jgi:hypothetical protein